MSKYIKFYCHFIKYTKLLNILDLLIANIICIQDTRYKIQDTRYFISGTKPIVKTY